MNFAELETAQTRPDFPLAACHRMGATHKAYRWGAKTWPAWTDAQRAAYAAGYGDRGSYDV